MARDSGDPQAVLFIYLLLTARPGDAANFYLPTIQALQRRRRRRQRSSHAQSLNGNDSCRKRRSLVRLLSLQEDEGGRGGGARDNEQHQRSDRRQILSRELGLDGIEIAGDTDDAANRKVRNHRQLKGQRRVVYGEEDVSAAVRDHIDDLVASTSILGIENGAAVDVVVITAGEGGAALMGRPDLHAGVGRLLEKEEAGRQSAARGRPDRAGRAAAMLDEQGQGEDDAQNEPRSGVAGTTTTVRICAWEVQDTDAHSAYYLPLLDWAYMLLMFLLGWVAYFLGLGPRWSSWIDSRGRPEIGFVDRREGRDRRVTCRLHHFSASYLRRRRHGLSYLFRRRSYVNVLRPFKRGDTTSSADHSHDGDDGSEVELEVAIEHEERVGDDGKPLVDYILTMEQMKSVAAKALPASVRHCRWERLYSLSRDGDAFGTFLHKVRGAERSLLVVKTTTAAKFGAYADSPWELHHGSFYGTGQTCLWEVTGDEGSQNHHTAGDKELVEVRVHKWTGLNSMIQACDDRKKMLAFGGGGKSGTFGLCVKDDFLRGTSGQCDTFNNCSLCGQDEFNVLDVECWGFLSAFA